MFGLIKTEKERTQVFNLGFSFVHVYWYLYVLNKSMERIKKACGLTTLVLLGLEGKLDKWTQALLNSFLAATWTSISVNNWVCVCLMYVRLSVGENGEKGVGIYRRKGERVLECV